MTSTLTAIGNEIYKGLRVAWSERLQLFIEIPMFVAFALLLGPILGQGDKIVSGGMQWSLDSETTSILIVWFIPFTFFQMQVVKMFWRLLAEIQAGTLEQVYLSPLPSWVVTALGRLVAALVETIIASAVMFAGVSLFVPLDLNLTPSVLLPVTLIIVIGVGVSLILAGATLIWKRMQQVTEAAMIIMFLGSVSAIPLVTMPAWWEGLGRLLPVNLVLENMFGVLFQGRSVTTPWGPGGLVWVLIAAAVYLVGGIVAFQLGEKAARRRGTLGRY